MGIGSGIRVPGSGKDLPFPDLDPQHWDIIKNIKIYILMKKLMYEDYPQ
jgi:hypothetical protein